MTNQPNTNAVALGLEAIRLLSQIAEACSLFVLEQGHDAELVNLSVHCSDRAEHVAQYFLEAPDKRWPLDSVLDDLAWLSEVDNRISPVRAKVKRNIPSLAEIKELSDRIRVHLESDAAPEPADAEHKQFTDTIRKFGMRTVTISQSLSDFERPSASTVPVTPELKGRPLYDDEGGPLFASMRELLKDGGKPYPLNLDGKITGHTMIIGSTGPMPDAHYQSVSAWAFNLHGRDFATLSQLELNQFRALRAAGRKFGLIVSIEVMHDSDEIQAELAAASPEQQEEIYRRLSTQVSVRWAMLDKT